jgi:serine/threonine-protein kinase
MLADRYRIVGLIGRGGMGEVYKAEDLKLNQTVALKFLPEEIALHGGMLARFHNEVRIARQVSHPAVCRVYDIGEVGGRHFLSMEFIDGEDLSTLLRRIGRLPADKAVELARQLCAGLAAAHEMGVLHRDLKPANVMIDGRGKARITDFGLAVVSEELRGEEAMAGTPAYMAPEQLTGKEVTQRSDIYALGLVLYELFTGKRVYEARTINELIRLHERSTPTTPSSHIKDMDPLAERVIMRCLEKNPKARPASAVQVAMALPGGDPLAAALAAGETPSPEMVAASGEKTGLRPAIAVALLAAVVVTLVAFALLGNKVSWVAKMLRENSRETLTVKAREIIKRLGYTTPPTDSASGFTSDSEVRLYFEKNFKSTNRWNRFTNAQPAPIQFWYRQSPRYLEPQSGASFGWVSQGDPPNHDVSGMVSIRLEPSGRMVYFKAVPPQVDAPGDKPPSPEWAPFFAAAGLDPGTLTPTESTWTPQPAFDTRAAWTGAYPEQLDVPIRIEAASYRGKLVYFNIVAPWQKPSMMEEFQPSTGEYVQISIIIFLFLTVIIGAVLLARHNLSQGRGDRRGAFRLAFFIFSVTLFAWILGASHPPTIEAFLTFFFMILGQPMLLAGMVWLIYIALEPYVRRRWPDTMVSWSRVLAGNLRDPYVGRDVLIGIVVGITGALLNHLGDYANFRVGATPDSGFPSSALLGVREFIASAFLSTFTGAILQSLNLFFLIFLLRLVTRRQWLTAVLFTLFLGLTEVPNESGNAMVAVAFAIIGAALPVIAALRYGFLTLVAFSYVRHLLMDVPITTDFSAWHASSGITAILAVMTVAALAFHTSLGGQKVFAGSLLDD